MTAQPVKADYRNPANATPAPTITGVHHSAWRCRDAAAREHGAVVIGDEGAVSQLDGEGDFAGEFGEKIVEPAVDGDLPAGLFKDLAVQRGDRVFAGVDAAAGQLEFGCRLGLMRDQDLGAPPQHGIDPRSETVSLAGLHGFAETADHGRPLVMAPVAPI